MKHSNPSDGEVHQLRLKEFEAELKTLIEEVEQTKKQHSQLLEENGQLRLENDRLKIKEQTYTHLEEENYQLKKEKAQVSLSKISEKDIAEVMLSAKATANLMLQKAHDEAEKVTQEKEERFLLLTADLQVLKKSLLSFKAHVDQELSRALSELEALLTVAQEKRNLNP